MFKAILGNRLSPEEIDLLVESELGWIITSCHPYRVYLFGSAAKYEMTDRSDLDFLVVLSDDCETKEVKKTYYQGIKDRTTPVDTVFVTATEFSKKSKIGGVCMICLDEGKLVYPRNAQTDGQKARPNG